MKKNMLYDKEVYEIQGAIFAVYREMGNAWHEEVYQQCLERELSSRMIPFDHKKELRIYYKGEPIEKTYIPDIICYDKIILELKTVDHLNNDHKGSVAELPTDHRHETWTSGRFQIVSESRNSSVGELIQFQNFFVSLRDGSKSRFVSAAGDETRQGEAEMAAPLKAKP